ncbi:MAG: LruC domain-containing protein [Parabacteroides sp.]|nr:LruC domain-containing protein [Parabacteroides sp.]
MDKTIWDISPVRDYTLTLQYDVPRNYQVKFDVYTQNPLEEGEGGQVTLRNIRPVDAGYTDENGYYSERITDIQSTIKELYIYTDAPGVPRLLVAKVNGNTLSPATLPEENTETKSPVMRAADDYKTAIYNQFVDGFTPCRLGYWVNGNGYYGRPDYLLADQVTVSDKVLKTIRKRLPEGKTPADIKEILVEGDIHVTKDARIKVYLIDEFTAANSVMGYYTYPTDKRPATRDDVAGSTVVLFPNAKVRGSGAGGYGAVKRGEGIQLHYFEDGVDKGEVFPTGVSVGWVIYNNGYKNAVGSNRKVTDSGNGKDVPSTFYSTPELNGGKKQVALFRIDQFVVLGMEDWKKDKDYNDVVFHITADPVDGITDKIPEVTPEDTPLVPLTVNPQGTLAFEDLWPRQGDFDLNDVVVKYKSEITYNENNEVTRTEDYFELLWSGATIHDAFCYQLNARRTDVDITFSGEAAAGAYVDPELDLATVRLFNDALLQTANNTKTTSVTVTTVFRKPYPKSQFRQAPYNPFITTSSKSKEVHLTNYPPTLLADPGYFGTEDDRSIYGQGTYYITFTGNGIQMPYALHIPADPDPEKDIPFVIPRESKRIDVFYPKFLNWVTSSGEQDGDWYLSPIDHPANSAPEGE